MNRLAAATLSLLVSLTPLLAGNQLNNNRNTSTKVLSPILERHTARMSSNDWHAFQDWMLSKNPPNQKKSLIQNTVLKAHYLLSESLWWFKSSISDHDFETLLDTSIRSPTGIISAVSGFYNYSPQYTFWVDFANADTFGGGFRGKGNVQEERMFMEFPQLSQLAFDLKRNAEINPVQNKKPEPFLVPRLQRLFDLSRVPYGHALFDISRQQIINDIQKLSAPYAIAHIIGIAAKDYSQTSHAEYSMNDLEYHLRAALLGWLSAKEYPNAKASPLEIHTGAWGSGAFKNSPKMITALQILAFYMAKLETGATLTFHGMNTSLVTPIATEIRTSLQGGITPQQLIKRFQNRQKTDSSWRPV